MASIVELLPRYYAARTANPSYDIVRLITIDGHECAWMHLEGETIEGRQYQGREFKCVCEFTEGVGWIQDPVRPNQKINLGSTTNCLYKATAAHLRILELRHEYIERFSGNWHDIGFIDVELVVNDLIEKVKNGEFIGEISGGAAFWGGYFYIQTLAEIVDRFVGHMWEPIRELFKEKKIGLEGAVITDYHEPQPPKWEEYTRYEEDGWIAIAFLPGHSNMAQEWHYEVLDPDGEKVLTSTQGDKLLHRPVFGPDIEDVNTAKSRLVDLLRQAQDI